jgi:uncharacterized protein (TIGR02118 family)
MQTSEQVRKFVLVVRHHDLDETFTDRLTGYLVGLRGTSIVHRARREVPDGGATEPPAAIIVEWYSSNAPEPAAWGEALMIDDEQIQWYEVSEALRWRRPGTSPRPDIGVSHICLVGRTMGLTVAQFEQHWTQVHRALAQEYHVGMELYVQNVVRNVLSANGQEIDGIAELGFRTVETFKTGMYDSEEGLKAISADVATFVGTAACGLYQLVPE